MEKIIVSAYCLYPDHKSSEGIVNKNWIDIVNEDSEHIKVVSQKKILAIDANKNFYNRKSRCLNILYKILKKPKKNLLKISYSICNKIFKLFVKDKNLTLVNYLWVKKQTKQLNLLQNEVSNNVYWGRILPLISLEPILNIYKKEKVPFIVNVNDPIVFNSDKGNSSQEEQVFINTINRAQCWTFPSQKLAAYFSEKYKLELSRCFVIPHAMRQQDILYGDYQKSINQKIKIIYTGTFYKSAFTKEFSEGLKRFCQLKESENIEFTFILSQYDNESIKWLKESIKDVKILTKLQREEVLEITSKANCVLVVDAITHSNLLKGKFVEAMSFGIPVLAVTYKNSVMDNVVREYGSFSAYQDVENDIFEKLKLANTMINSEKWNESFIMKRETVMAKISEESIQTTTQQIVAYAKNRFLWEKGELTIKPIAPSNCNWP
jgi:glycosyltransferase involved in cell wall biosynthesis